MGGGGRKADIEGRKVEGTERPGGVKPLFEWEEGLSICIHSFQQQQRVVKLIICVEGGKNIIILHNVGFYENNIREIFNFSVRTFSCNKPSRQIKI